MRPRRPVRLTAIRFLLGLTILVGGCQPERPLRPDLVLVSVDALRADALSCYGGRADLGAEVCALGDHGARYVWAFSTASTGGSAAASLLTSLSPSRHGVVGSAAHFLPHGAESVAEALHRAGYATAAFIASPELNRSRNFDQGFDLFDDGLSSAGVTDTDSVGDRVVAWANTAPSPWFAWVHFAEPHGDVAGRAASPDDYETSIRRLDRRLSQLIAVLDARPAPPGILLIGLHGRLSDDHSGASLHGRGVSLEEIRVPLLWRPPRTVAGPMVGRRITRPVSALDVAPTLLEAAAVKPLGAAEGRPLPLADPARHEAPTRVIRAEHPREIAIVVGAEYLAASRERTEAGSPKEVRSALLWSPGERTRESLPALDPPGVSAERLARLGPQLEAALGADVPSD